MNTLAPRVEAKIHHNGMEETLRFLTGGSDQFTVIPKAIWRKLKLVPQCEGASGGQATRTTEKLFTHCVVEIGQRLYETLAILGDKDDDPRLGFIIPVEWGRRAA